MNSGSTLIIVPSYNEELNISEVLKKLKSSIKNISADILVMDDGSVDKTYNIALREGVKVIKLITNLGNGGAVQTAFRYAVKKNYDYVMMFDADGQHDSKYIVELIDYIKQNSKYDMVIGSRYLNRTKLKSISFRELGTRIFSWIASKIIKMKITDCTSGFRILNRRAFSFLSRGNNYPQKYPDADFIISFGKNKFCIGEYHMDMHERTEGESMHIGILHSTSYILKMIISIISLI